MVHYLYKSGSIVLIETIDALYYRSNKRVSTLGTIEQCRQKGKSKVAIRRPDNKDNKYRENNEVQSTMVTTVMTVYCTAIDKIYRLMIKIRLS